MAYKESDFQSEFTKWLRLEREHGRHLYSAAFELKVARSPRLALSAFQPQQLPMLTKAKHACVYKKLSDLDPSLKPFDAFQICVARAFVVVLFYKARQKKQMVWIDVDDFTSYFSRTATKSITENDARNLGQIYDL